MNCPDRTNGRLAFRNSQSAIRICVSTLCVFTAISIGISADAAESTYRLLVCLQFSDDPLFTRLYTSSVQRQVKDQLSNYFGSLAQVEVATQHPLLERIAGDDVRSLEPAASEFAALQIPDKAFVFSLRNADGLYQLHWRQLDGLMQQVSSPQTQLTPDRQWLTKAICLAVRNDFAPVVVVKPDEAVKDTGQVKLEFASAAHRQLIGRWLTLDTILQPFWVLKQKDGSLVRVPIPYTVLRIGKNDTGGTATFHSNASNPWKPTPRLVRYEALKVSTQAGHLRIRMVNSEDGSPMTGCIVRANTQGYAAQEDSHLFTIPDRRGTVVSLKPIEHLAFVDVLQGGRSWLKIPVAITAPMCELTLKISRDESAKEKSDWDRRLRYLVQDVSILQTSINNQVRDTNQMHDEKKYEEELRLIKSVLVDVTAGREAANRSRDGLDREAGQLKLPPSTLLTWADAQLKEIGGTEKALAKKAADLDAMIQKMDAQARAQVLINAGDAAADLGDYAEALDKYGLALAEQPDQPKLTQRIKDLKGVWEIKSPAHEQARTFVFERWAKTEVTELTAQFDEAERALATLREVGDYLTAQRLLKVNNEHIAGISGVIDLLISSGSERDVEDAAKYQQLLDKMAGFQQRIGDFIQTAASGGAAPAAPAPAAAAPQSKAPPAEEEEVPNKKT